MKSRIKIILFILTWGLTGLPATKATGESRRALTGIRRGEAAEHQLPPDREQRLLDSLRRITGLANLYFAADGRLTLPQPEPGRFDPVCGGAPTAQRVLLEAIESPMTFLIEDHSGSPMVNFGQLDQGLIYEQQGDPQRHLIWRVRLDFTDFDGMQASPEVRAAFDVGFVFLHELLHGLGYRDPKDWQEIGECETVINRARTELGLPVRELYFGEPVKLTDSVTTVRLRFKSPASPLAEQRAKSYSLFFLLPPPQNH